jgi:hypothetical protein
MFRLISVVLYFGNHFTVSENILIFFKKIFKFTHNLIELYVKVHKGRLATFEWTGLTPPPRKMSFVNSPLNKKFSMFVNLKRRKFQIVGVNPSTM